MITTETHPTEGSAESVHGHSSRRGIIVTVATLLTVVGFAFAGTPVATAAPKFVESNFGAILDDPNPCRPGDKPGPCPYFLDRTVNQGSMTSSNQNTAPTTPQSSRP